MNKYNPTYEEYRNKVVGHIIHATRFPQKFTRCDIEHFHKMTYELLQDDIHPNQIGSELFDVFAVENLDFLSIAIIASNGFQAFAILKKAKAEGVTTVRGLSVHDGCIACKSAVDKKTYEVDVLLREYDKNLVSSILLPHISCAHMGSEGEGWCRCSWALMSNIDTTGVDPGFVAWLTNRLKNMILLFTLVCRSPQA